MKYLGTKMMVVIVLLMWATVALSQTTITTGSKKGTYYRVGQNLGRMLGSSNVIPSKGSVQNLERLMSGEAQVGLVQMDAFAWFLGKHPEASSELEVMGTLYEECAYLAVRCNGKVRDEDDLQSKSKKATIAVGPKGSGTAVTWDYMIQLEPGYKNSSVVFQGGTRALGKLAAKNLDAVMWVTKPKLDGKMAATVMRNKELCLRGFNDMDLNDKLPATGKPVYHFRSIDIKKGFFNDKEIKTACVDAVIVARSDTDEDVLEAISDALLNYKTSLLK